MKKMLLITLTALATGTSTQQVHGISAHEIIVDYPLLLASGMGKVISSPLPIVYASYGFIIGAILNGPEDFGLIGFMLGYATGFTSAVYNVYQDHKQAKEKLARYKAKKIRKLVKLTELPEQVQDAINKAQSKQEVDTIVAEYAKSLS